MHVRSSTLAGIAQSWDKAGDLWSFAHAKPISRLFRFNPCNRVTPFVLGCLFTLDRIRGRQATNTRERIFLSEIGDRFHSS
ncbi:hypothetical protein COCOBI_pt-0980 (chloroplast) [Coccomyxa sp. Obi]|nr:hypothetical protein COCOBI_pt-0980 [Coccomyxa sp. Obi]